MAKLALNSKTTYERAKALSRGATLYEGNPKMEKNLPLSPGKGPGDLACTKSQKILRCYQKIVQKMFSQTEFEV